MIHLSTTTKPSLSRELSMNTENLITSTLMIQLFIVGTGIVFFYNFFLGLSGGKEAPNDINSRTKVNEFLNLIGTITRKIVHFLMFIPVIFIVLIEEYWAFAHKAGLAIRNFVKRI